MCGGALARPAQARARNDRWKSVRKTRPRQSNHEVLDDTLRTICVTRFALSRNPRPAPDRPDAGSRNCANRRVCRGYRLDQAAAYPHPNRRDAWESAKPNADEECRVAADYLDWHPCDVVHRRGGDDGITADLTAKAIVEGVSGGGDGAVLRRVRAPAVAWPLSSSRVHVRNSAVILSHALCRQRSAVIRGRERSGGSTAAHQCRRRLPAHAAFSNRTHSAFCRL